MRRRTVLLGAATAAVAGCVSVSIGGNNGEEPSGGSPASVDQGEDNQPDTSDNTTNSSTGSGMNESESSDESTSDVEEGPDPAERPIIHELSLDYDESWLMMSRQYEVPNAGDEFSITEQWHVTDADGATVFEEDREETVESNRDIESVLVSGGTWYIGRWDNNIQAGEYTVELIIVGADGAESEPERQSITIESDPTS